MGAILAFIKGKPPETPIKGFIPRVKNIVIQHFRGILGVLVPILLLSWQLNLKTASVTAVHIWILMFCFFLFQPVSIQVTGMIPIFAFPMMGLYPTVQVVKMYFNEGVALFIIAGMLHLLLNNSGFDRRIILAILCAGKAKSGFTPIKLLCKCSCAGFLMSMFCHRLIVASTLIQYITPILMEAQGKAAEFTKLRYVINNSIQISCALGGIVIVHASYCTLAYRAIFYGSVKDVQWPELLNYLRYTAFALPLALIIFVLNLIYHIILLKIRAKPVPEYKMTLFRTNLIKYKSQIPSKITNHEKLTIIFEILALAMLFGRYIDINSGAGWNKVNPNWSSANDATVAAIFVVMLHVLPRSCTFVKVCLAKKKSQLPPTKPESAILFWRFVDKNTNYGYFFVIGSGVALWFGLLLKTENHDAGQDFSKKFEFLTSQSFCIGLLLICLITVVLTNIISGVAALAIWIPVVQHIGNSGSIDSLWKTSRYRAVMAVGIGSSFGFISPFLYTPAYFCHHTGKVPKRVMLKYSLIPCLISALVLYATLCYLAPSIFGMNIEPYSVVSTTEEVTTAAPP